MTDRSILQRAIGDARALLDTMVGSDLARLHVSAGGVDIFISRHAEPSPLLARLGAPVDDVAASLVEHRITAPHVATLVVAAAIGEQVEAGQTIATIAVLDAQETLSSPMSGRIAKLEAASGDLIQYGQTLVVIEAAA